MWDILIKKVIFVYLRVECIWVSYFVHSPNSRAVAV